MEELFGALPGAVAQGLIWGILAVGVYITFKILSISDLTVDGSICTGMCVCAVLITAGVPAWLAVLIAFVAGALAGFQGLVQEVDSDRQKVRVLVTIFNRETTVELDFTQVKKV